MGSRALSTSTSGQAIPKKWIEKLFDRMLLTYGKKFTDQWEVTDLEQMKTFWAERLSHLSGDELARGVGKLETRDWPPTLPEFLKMCRPDADPFAQYCEAVAGLSARARGEMGKWSHPAVYWAAVSMAHELTSQTYATVQARWAVELSTQMAEFAWEPIPQPALALPAPGKSPLSRENAAKMLRELNAKKIFNHDRDPRDWYLRVLKRHADGDSTVSAIQLKFAQEAEENHRSIV